MNDIQLNSSVFSSFLNMMKNIRLYTFAVLFADLCYTQKNCFLHCSFVRMASETLAHFGSLYRKSRDKLSSSDVKLSSRINLSKAGYLCSIINH